MFILKLFMTMLISAAFNTPTTTTSNVNNEETTVCTENVNEEIGGFDYILTT